MKKSTLSVQSWIDNLPTSPPTMPLQTVIEARTQPHGSPSRNHLRLIGRDSSIQSDDCSTSSMERVLEFRKADPEAVLLGLGFGPPNSGVNSRRIPARFLQPSKLLTQIDINKFLEEQGELQEDGASDPSSPAKMKPNY